MSNVPADNASQEEKIKYIEANYGVELAKDLLAAAGSGTIPEALKGFLGFKIKTPEIPTNGGYSGTPLSVITLLGHQSSNYNKEKRLWDYTNHTTNSNGHELIEQALIKAAASGNNDFLKAFLSEKLLSIKPFVDGSNDRKELPLKMLETAIENNQIKTLDLLLHDEYMYKQASNPYPATKGNWGAEVENDHNKILDLVVKYAGTNPEAVAHVMNDTRIMADAQKEMARAKALETALSGVSFSTKNPEITQQVVVSKKSV